MGEGLRVVVAQRVGFRTLAVGDALRLGAVAVALPLPLGEAEAEALSDTSARA